MKRIDGIQIGSQIFRYGSNVFQTDGGVLLMFTAGADKWAGVFPGCSWDHFYDNIMVNLNCQYMVPLVFKQRFSKPTIIEGSTIGSCVKCSEPTDYKFCSVSCWFFDTIELVRNIIAEADSQSKIDRNVAFVEQMVLMFGQQVDEEQLNPTQR